jgi:hypothetical protein
VRERKSKSFDFKDFVLTDSLGPSCANSLICPVTGKQASWLRADFDENGRPDLVVTGYRNSDSSRRYVMCFLDQGEQKFAEFLFAAGAYNCDVPQLGHVGGKPIIRYVHTQLRGARFSKRKAVCQRDTLIFRESSFVEYNRAPRNYRIEKLAFSTDACYGTCPIFDLRLARNGAATYHAEEYNEKKGDFAAVIKAQPLAEIWTLLNYLNFPKLQNDYSVSATDHPTCTLTITYGGGKVKTIQDYGEQGTFGLRQLYRLLFALRTTQDWK